MSLGLDPIVSSLFYSLSLLPHLKRPARGVPPGNRQLTVLPYVSVLVTFCQETRDDIEMTVSSFLAQTYPPGRFEVLMAIEPDDEPVARYAAESVDRQTLPLRHQPQVVFELVDFVFDWPRGRTGRLGVLELFPAAARAAAFGLGLMGEMADADLLNQLGTQDTTPASSGAGRLRARRFVFDRPRGRTGRLGVLELFRQRRGRPASGWA